MCRYSDRNASIAHPSVPYLAFWLRNRRSTSTAKSRSAPGNEGPTTGLCENHDPAAARTESSPGRSPQANIYSNLFNQRMGSGSAAPRAASRKRTIVTSVWLTRK